MTEPPTPSARPTRPNVILVMTDQHRADHLGFAGAPVRTPRLDGLAARGRVFTSTWVANPICTPNRASILTGRVPSAHGSRHNGLALDPRATTFVRQLRSAGYRTGLVGKLHVQSMGDHPELMDLVSPREPATEGVVLGEPGWDDLELEERFDDPGLDHRLPGDLYGFEHVELTVQHSDFVGGHYRRWLREQGVDPDQVQGERGATSVAPEWDQVRTAGVPAELYPTTWLGERGAAFVERHGGGDRPFFLQLSFPDPHHPFTPPAPYDELYDPDELPLPRTFDDPHTGSLPHVRAMIDQRGTQPFRLAPFAPTARQLRLALAAQFGMITLIDEAVGRVLDALASAGIAEETVVVFTSDHGDMFGDHGLLLKGGMHYRGTTQVPLVITGPGIAPGATSSMASSLDLAATMCDLTGAPRFRGDQGHSLVPVLDDPDATVRTKVLIEEELPFPSASTGRPLRMRTLVTEEARITRYHGIDHGELFDLVADPDELRNRYDDPATADLQRAMNDALLQAMLDHVDEPRRATYTG